MDTTIETTVDGSKGLPYRIRECLRAEILRGVLHAGEPLKQDALAARFQSSRIPVREALRQLEAEGLVTYERNRGAVVAMMDLTLVCEILDVRIALECYAARIAVPNMVARDYDAMRDILDAYSASNSAAEWSDYNRRFHLALSAPSNNQSLRKLIDEYVLNTDRYTHEMMPATTVKDGPQAEHYLILDACIRKQPLEVAALLEEHILESKKNLIASARLRQEKWGLAQ